MKQDYSSGVEEIGGTSVLSAISEGIMFSKACFVIRLKGKVHLASFSWGPCPQNNPVDLSCRVCLLTDAILNHFRFAAMRAQCASTATSTHAHHADFRFSKTVH